MIATTDIQTILYKDVQKLGIKKVYKNGVIPEGDVKSERVAIIVNSVEPGTYWKAGFVHVNICVPYLDRKGTAYLTRLNVLERLASKVLHSTSTYDGTAYTYDVDTTRIEEDRDLKCFYVNVRILFQVLNVKE